MWPCRPHAWRPWLGAGPGQFDFLGTAAAIVSDADVRRSYAHLCGYEANNDVARSARVNAAVAGVAHGEISALRSSYGNFRDGEGGRADIGESGDHRRTDFAHHFIAEIQVAR